MSSRLAGGIALSLVVVAVFLIAGSQTIAMIEYRATLAERYAAQEAPLIEGGKLRGQMQAIAGELEELAGSGDAGAKQVLEALRRQGIVVSPRKP